MRRYQKLLGPIALGMCAWGVVLGYCTKHGKCGQPMLEVVQVVGGFHWPSERARDGDVETILASAAASKTSAEGSSMFASWGEGSKISPVRMVLSARSVKQHEQNAEKQVVTSWHRRPLTSSNSSSGGSTQRSESTCTHSSSASTGSYKVSGLPSFRSPVPSLGGQQQNSGCRSRSCSSGTSGRRARPPISYDATHEGGGSPAIAEQQVSHRTSGSISSSGGGGSTSSRSSREDRLRPPTLLGRGAPLPSPSSAPKHPRLRSLDPVFHRHHKYDLIAVDRAKDGQMVTGRFGPVQGSSILAASLLTSELSTPWSHVLRGQKW